MIKETEDLLKVVPIEAKSKKDKKSPFDKRIAIIDFLRGFFLLLVFFDHLMYNLHDFLPGYFTALGINSGAFYDWANDFLFTKGPNQYFSMPLRNTIRQVALASFVMLSGISCAFSKNNWHRAVKMIAFYLGLGVISNIANGYASKLGLHIGTLVINFNVIGVVAICVMIYCFFEKKSSMTILCLTIVMFFLAYFIIPHIYNALSDQPAVIWPLWEPDKIVVNGHIYYMADYMPLFPYALFFFVGVIVSRNFYNNPKEHLKHNYKWMKPMCFLGRHSLIFYLGHQIFYVIIFLLIGIGIGAY